MKFYIKKNKNKKILYKINKLFLKYLCLNNLINKIYLFLNIFKNIK